MGALNLSITEIIVLQLGAVILGIAIHFFLSSRRALKGSGAEAGAAHKLMEDWKLKYLNDMEQKGREMEEFKKQLSESEEEKRIHEIEAEEQRHQNKLLKSEMEKLQVTPKGEKVDFIDQLKQAQENLKEQHRIINQLAEQLDHIALSEEQQKKLAQNNTELSEQVSELKTQLYKREKELEATIKKENMSREMTSMLDNAYSEFSMLQEKIQKMESDAGSARLLGMELSDLKESHRKMKRDFDEQKHRLSSLAAENQQLQIQLSEAGEGLKESEFERQQLQKKVIYLEELNKDFQLIADANKKLEQQIKQIGELESMLNVVSEERDKLASRQISQE